MLEVVIPFQEYSEDIEANKLVQYLEEKQKELNLEDSTIYYKFPMLKEFDEKATAPDFFILSPKHGIILINKNDRDKRLLTENDIDILYDRMDSIYSLVLSKLIKVSGLRKKRSRNELRFPISTIIYLPNNSEHIDEDNENNYWANNLSDFSRIISSVEIDPIADDVIKEIYAVIDGTKGIPRPVKREISPEDHSSKGAILSNLDQQIAQFDTQQKLAALSIIDGPQRIRGMAGSGKTIILAMKAAIIHMENPDAKILYTFYTKSLYDQIKQLITRFYRMYEDHDPDWEKIQILHAWGGKNLPGVYYNACINNGVNSLTLANAKYGATQKNMKPFEFVCYDLLERLNGEVKAEYDYVLLDEGQDFPNTFYWLCRKLVRNDRIVWAYDELQNILDIKLQKTNQLFENEFEKTGIDLSSLQENYPHQNNDIVLHKSYRNPLEILLVAHAIGFGLYNDKILQSLENKEHWEDLGYKILEGDLIKGERLKIQRPKENSPSLISDYYHKDEIINVYVAETFDEELTWVSDQIRNDIDSKLLPEDIMVICLDDKYVRRYFTLLEDKLAEKNIYANNLLNSYSGDDFILKGKVTLSTVYRAKGNEAAMVYVIGADSVEYGKDDIVSRNKLFTSFTRAKAWLKLSGIGKKFNYLIEEIQQAKNNIPYLIFDYPGYEEIKTLSRELAFENAKMNDKREKLLKNLSDLDIDIDTARDMLQGEIEK